MREDMSPSRGSDSKRGLTFERRWADRTRMRSSGATVTAPSTAAPAADVRRAGERGQALVEFALVAPLFLFLVVGIIQFGIGLNYWLDLNRIANQGARWGVVNKYPNCSGQVSDPDCVAPTLAEYLESEPVSGGLQPTATICFEPAVSPALPGEVGQPLTVRMTTDFTFMPIMDLGKITLRGKATMRLEQPPTVLQAQGVGTC